MWMELFKQVKPINNLMQKKRFTTEMKKKMIARKNGIDRNLKNKKEKMKWMMFDLFN